MRQRPTAQRTGKADQIVEPTNRSTVEPPQCHEGHFARYKNRERAGDQVGFHVSIHECALACADSVRIVVLPSLTSVEPSERDNRGKWVFRKTRYLAFIAPIKKGEDKGDDSLEDRGVSTHSS